MITSLQALHPYIYNLIQEENKRQNKTIELIASENFVSPSVLEALGSCLTNKYSEGYPEKRYSGNKGRYYGGCQVVDELEEYCCAAWRKVFDTNYHYHVNVQPHSGSQANYAAFAAVLNPGDRILSMDLNHGGHLTHGSPVNFSGKLYNIEHYGVDENGYIDYNDIKSKITEFRPNLILLGASAYPRIINFAEIHKLILDTCIKNEITVPYIMVDMSHIAGLIAVGLHPTPFGYADIITTTTHKTLRGPRGGLIFCTKNLAKKIDSAVFPGSQGGPLQNVIAAKAVCAEEVMSSEYEDYIYNVVENCKAMSKQFIKLGYELVTGGTDNHLFLIDFTHTHPELTGKDVQTLLDNYDITLNKNCVPNEKRSPMLTSGVRIGTAAITARYYDKAACIQIADKIDELITDYCENNSLTINKVKT